MTDPAKQELEKLQKRVAELEAEIKPRPDSQNWDRSEVPFYPTYLAWSGAILGMIAAVASLLVNIIGSLVVGQHPLKLIQIYLTFPMGEAALADGLNSGIIMAVGCCLYILTGAVLAIPLQLFFVRFMPKASLGVRLGVATVAGVLLWAINYYLILSWLQPRLFGGNWIVEQIPPWIGALTHVVFAWVIAALSPWGTFDRAPARGNESVTPAKEKAKPAEGNTAS